MDASGEEIDLYEVLGIQRGASQAEIKKAYHKSALSSHPDKVSESERADAEIKFKQVSQAYEILYNEETRQMYDTHGMAAFEKGSGGMGGPDLDDILAQMFGMNVNMDGAEFPGMNGRRGPRKSPNEEKQYEVSLEELYKGKNVRFQSSKNVICQVCNGSGGKEKTKPKTCDTCKGQGVQIKLQPVGPGLVTRATVSCSTCGGRGSFYKDKDRCKKCKGAGVNKEKKMLELYIPPGSRHGERIILAGEADQKPDQEPGDIIFEIAEKAHETFQRAGADLAANLDITLAEALTGFDRVILTHLDGRGLQLNVQQPHGKILRPGQILKVPGEGMPVKKGHTKGDLYLQVSIEFPEDGWLKDQATLNKLVSILPSSELPETPEEVDEIEVEYDADMDEFGAGSGDPRSGAEWEDDDEAGAGGAQCAQQ